MSTSVEIDALEALRAALRDLEEFARVPQTVETRERLRDVIPRMESQHRLEEVRRVPVEHPYKQRLNNEPKHIRDDA